MQTEHSEQAEAGAFDLQDSIFTYIHLAEKNARRGIRSVHKKNSLNFLVLVRMEIVLRTNTY